MSAADLLKKLKDLDIYIYLDDGYLKCKAPESVLSSEIIDQLRYRKNELIELLANERKVDNSHLAPVSRTGLIPLSYAQQRLWFLNQLEPDSSFYNIPITLKLAGNLNTIALEQSFNEIIRRHEVLRTSFVTENEQVHQLISDKSAFSVAYVNLAELPSITRQTAMDNLIVKEKLRVFDLTEAPLARATILNLSRDTSKKEAILLIVLHHIISDGWSSGVLIREFVALYGAFHQGGMASLPELSIQYADFAYWQQKWLTGNNLKKQIDYWRKKLEGASNIIELPTDRPRPAVMRYCGRSFCFSIPKLLVRNIQILCRTHGVTLYVYLVAAFNVLLFRHSHQTDLCVGTPAANRNRIEIQGLIGFFVNTLVIRSDLSNNPRFSALLAQVKHTVLNAQSYQDLPFDKLIEVLNPQRNTSYNLLFQVMFVLQNKAQYLLKLPDLNISSVENESATSKFDLTLNIEEDESEVLNGTFEYNTDLYDSTTIARFAEHYLTLLQGIVDTPESRLSELPLLTQRESQQILIDWNATEVDYPANRYIQHLFEAQAEKLPNAVAVVFEGQSLTYAELNSKANQLAHYLGAHGIGPDVLVSICLERSLEMVIGLLGILKAGGAYVPLDPGYPQERLDFMLRDVGAAVVLTQTACREKLKASSATVLCLDGDWDMIAKVKDNNPDIQLMPENLAYCIYTSGSTGQPKAACITHQGILNRLQWMQEQYRLNGRDCVLQKTPYSFDVSVWEFFWPLMTGAQLVVAKPDEHKDNGVLVDTIIREQITTIHFVPSMLQAFIDTPGVESCTSLKRVICSGEALPADLVVRFQNKLPTELHNLYGPTEASVDVSYWACLPDCPETAIPIGRPIANIRLYILDRQLNPVPLGTPGELHIAGIGLGRGYLNRPELTAEKFILSPFGPEGSRLYKTGDLARYRIDGNIDYLGRIDYQVKIRGFRIELGEIEARLLKHPNIKEAAVLAREDTPGDKRLVAYLVVVNKEAADVEQLKHHLQETLPDYMLPGAFVLLDSMPLSANGKLDRKRLRQPDNTVTNAKQYVAPRSTTQEILSGIWADVLGVENVGVEDNFFELGGHSLLATQLVSRICMRFEIQLQLKALFDTASLAQLAAKVDLLVWAKDQQKAAESSAEIELEDIEL
ncbi:non-ribosomal peptide synthetase [Methylomonas fluvii]|uniref:Amino acid adenylation domain-containing protein n=1 Tax=Methylomonas fluvii TaxID=1854564 RepID=A0ABR9DGX1_9GAMM|nr:non-ribosomal peptide synthetase [Methylomonas fluvii]MBD9361553.1 amino acid adenylation domain-containing protein [Methylomonas fluvii]